MSLVVSVNFSRDRSIDVTFSVRPPILKDKCHKLPTMVMKRPVVIPEIAIQSDVLINLAGYLCDITRYNRPKLFLILKHVQVVRFSGDHILARHLITSQD
jgi:hypothetical protein